MQRIEQLTRQYNEQLDGSIPTPPSPNTLSTSPGTTPATMTSWSKRCRPTRSPRNTSSFARSPSTMIRPGSCDSSTPATSAIAPGSRTCCATPRPPARPCACNLASTCCACWAWMRASPSKACRYSLRQIEVPLHTRSEAVSRAWSGQLTVRQLNALAVPAGGVNLARRVRSASTPASPARQGEQASQLQLRHHRSDRSMRLPLPLDAVPRRQQVRVMLHRKLLCCPLVQQSPPRRAVASMRPAHAWLIKHALNRLRRAASLIPHAHEAARPGVGRAAEGVLSLLSQSPADAGRISSAPPDNGCSTPY